VILSRGNRLRLDLALPSSEQSAADDSTSADGSRAEPKFMTAEEFRQQERENIVAALEHSNWKVSGPGGAAELLGIKPSTLNYQIKVMGIKKPA
jgi:transcriptional regulator with GAF, ATPase, and Fis domain